MMVVTYSSAGESYQCISVNLVKRRVRVVLTLKYDPGILVNVEVRDGAVIAGQISYTDRAATATRSGE